MSHMHFFFEVNWIRVEFFRLEQHKHISTTDIFEHLASYQQNTVTSNALIPSKLQAVHWTVFSIKNILKIHLLAKFPFNFHMNSIVHTSCPAGTKKNIQCAKNRCFNVNRLIMKFITINNLLNEFKSVHVIHIRTWAWINVYVHILFWENFRLVLSASIRQKKKTYNTQSWHIIIVHVVKYFDGVHRIWIICKFGASKKNLLSSGDVMKSKWSYLHA